MTEDKDNSLRGQSQKCILKRNAHLWYHSNMFFITP